jgi:hypothetical protein
MECSNQVTGHFQDFQHDEAEEVSGQAISVTDCSLMQRELYLASEEVDPDSMDTDVVP